MRIVHVLESIEQDAGAVLISLRGLIRGLMAGGRAVDVVVLQPAPRDTTIEGAAVYGPDDAPAGKRLDEADVVHFHGCAEGRATEMMWTLCRAGTPYVLSPCGDLGEAVLNRSSWWRRLLGGRREIAAARCASVLAACNDVEARELEARSLNDRVVTLPYGLAFDEYADVLAEDQSAHAGERELLMLGPIHPIEGCVPLLKALAEISASVTNWKLVFAGSSVGAWRKMIESAVRRKGGEAHVDFRAAADLGAQRAALRRATLVASPALRVRCPVTVLQALAAGVPVLASPDSAPPGMEQWVRVCKPRREALKRELREMFAWSEIERTSVAEQARLEARRRFDWSVLIDRYVELYREIA